MHVIVIEPRHYKFASEIHNTGPWTNIFFDAGV